MGKDNSGNEQKYIITHLNNSRMSEAFDGIHDLIRDFDTFQDDLMQLQSQYSRYEKDKILSTQSDQESQLNINRISYSLRKLLKEFQDKTLKTYFNINSFQDEIFDVANQDALLLKILRLRLEPMGYRIMETGVLGKEDHSNQSVHRRGSTEATPVSDLKKEVGTDKSKITPQVQATGEDTPSLPDNSSHIIKGSTSIYIPLKKIESGYDAIAQVMRKTSLCQKEKDIFRSLLGLKHRNVIKVMDVHIDLYPFLIINERIYGNTLGKSLQMVGRRPVSQVADWMYQLSDALLYLNQKGIHHSNVRPSKIYIDDEFHLMISPLDLITMNLDLGEKSWLDFRNFWEVCKYGSPEFVKQYGPGKTTTVSTRFVCSDEQFSLGAVAFYALTGDELFSGDSVMEILYNRRQFEEDPQTRLHLLNNISDINSRGGNTLKDVVCKLLSIKPEERYGSLSALIKDIHRLIHADIDNTCTTQMSYRRALANNRGLIQEFYTSQFFKRSERAREIFDKIKDEKAIMNKQYAMLQMAVDVILNHQDVNYRENLRRILVHHHTTSENIHSKIDIKDYEIFMDSLISTIKDSDPEFSKNNEIEKAWLEASDFFIQNIKAIFSSGGGYS